jgi:lipopolysaccharide export system permease protein
VEDVQDKWLIKPTIWMFSGNSSELITIHSEKARIAVNLDKDLLTIELVDSFVDVDRDKQMKWNGSQTIELPLNKASKAGSTSSSPTSFSMVEIPQQLRAHDEENERRREQLAANFSFAVGSGRYIAFNDPMNQHIQHMVYETESRMARFRTEPMRRWALGFSCLAFVWMGVPLAILIRSADYWWSFGLCFIPILLVYYPVFGLALELSKKGTWPAVTLWLGNVVLAAIGTWLMRKVTRA